MENLQPLFLKLIAALSMVVGLLSAHHLPPKMGSTLRYDPAGATVVSTTIPMVVASQTVMLSLQTVSSSVVLGLVAANVHDQFFIANNGCLILSFPVQSATIFTGCTDTNLSNPWTVNLDPIITLPGSYPFVLKLLLLDQTSLATGTILAQ